MTLCLVAGQGRLPHLLAERVQPDRIAALEGFLPEGLEVDHVFRVETLGSFLKTLGRAGVTRICFAGSIRRPKLDAKRVDTATLPLVPRMMKVLGQGDDAALRMVLGLFEDRGIIPVGAHELLPELLPPAGVAVGTLPKGAEHDADRASAILAAMGGADVGQACVVARGQALAVEALPGTDWMLDTVIAARGEQGEGDANPLYRKLPAGGMLFKAPKPGQDRRIDLPTIGPGTVARAARARLEGIVIEAQGVMVLDADETMALARDRGLYLWVRPR